MDEQQKDLTQLILYPWDMTEIGPGDYFVSARYFGSKGTITDLSLRVPLKKKPRDPQIYDPRFVSDPMVWDADINYWEGTPVAFTTSEMDTNNPGIVFTKAEFKITSDWEGQDVKMTFEDTNMTDHEFKMEYFDSFDDMDWAYVWVRYHGTIEGKDIVSYWSSAKEYCLHMGMNEGCGLKSFDFTPEKGLHLVLTEPKVLGLPDTCTGGSVDLESPSWSRTNLRFEADNLEIYYEAAQFAPGDYDLEVTIITSFEKYQYHDNIITRIQFTVPA